MLLLHIFSVCQQLDLKGCAGYSDNYFKSKRDGRNISITTHAMLLLIRNRMKIAQPYTETAQIITVVFHGCTLCFFLILFVMGAFLIPGDSNYKGRHRKCALEGTWTLSWRALQDSRRR